MTAERPLRVALVSNAPAPYRVPALRLVAQSPDIALDVIYCAPAHIDTSPASVDHGFEPHYLQGRYIALAQRFLHADMRIVPLLNRLKPDVVVTCGFIPTYLGAFAWAWLTGRSHVVFIDGTLHSESGLSRIHRLVRRLVFSRTAAFLGASEGSSNLFRAFGVDESRIFKAPLAVHFAHFQAQPPSERVVDLLFSGRLIEHKSPLFALEVAAGAARRLGRRVSIDFLGTGEQLPALQARAADLTDFVQARFLGHLPQAELPAAYTRAKIFLFPTKMDPWGVVVNEAAAAGLAIVASPHTGVVGELLRDGETGRVLPLELQAWINAVVTLLGDLTQCERMGSAARECVSTFSFETAARQFRRAILKAANRVEG